MKLRSVLLSCTFMLLGLAAFAQYNFPKFEVAVDYSYARTRHDQYNPATCPPSTPSICHCT